jgi:hypothetical protein
MNLGFEYFQNVYEVSEAYKMWSESYAAHKFPTYQKDGVLSILRKFNHHLAPSIKYLNENFKVTKDGFVYGEKDEYGQINEPEFTVQIIDNSKVDINPFNGQETNSEFQKELRFIEEYVAEHKRKRLDAVLKVVKIKQLENQGYEFNKCKVCFVKCPLEEFICF